MNKTVTINISGVIFHIEEDAYEKLQDYLTRIRNRFSEEEGRDEIMADIEARIAEIFNAKTGIMRQVIVMTDVDNVIAQMGEPEAIADGEEKRGEEKTAEEEAPGAEGYRRTHRRLYRDTDDRVFGGVCSGLGYYFDIDPVWIRIAFAIAFFVFGTGFLFYLLLMIIIPKAETTAEKLEMKGEPVDVNNISRSIKEEFMGFKKKVKDFGNEAKLYGKQWKREHYYWYRRNRVRSGVEDFFQAVFHFIGRIFAFALVFFGILFLIGLLTSTFTLSDLGPGMISSAFRNLFSDGTHYTLAITAFLLFFGVPILMMIYKGFRLLFRIRKPDRIVGISALVLWLFSILIAVFAIQNAAGAFAERAHVHENIPLVNPKAGNLTIRVNPDPEMINDDYDSDWNRRYHYARHWKMFNINDKNAKFGYPGLHIVASENDSLQLIMYRYARGRTADEAMKNARAIHYTITQQDSLLIFNPSFTIDDATRWRAQDVDLELRVPKGVVITLQQSAVGILSETDNEQDASPDNMVNRRWKMTDHGLTCIDCGGLLDESSPAQKNSPAQNDSVK